MKGMKGSNTMSLVASKATVGGVPQIQATARPTYYACGFRQSSWGKKAEDTSRGQIPLDACRWLDEGRECGYLLKCLLTFMEASR